MQKRDWAKDWEMCEKATPGPWELGIEHSGDIYGRGCRYYVEEIVPVAIRPYDAVFIAEAREALPYWLQRVRELEDIVKRLQQGGGRYEPFTGD